MSLKKKSLGFLLIAGLTLTVAAPMPAAETSIASLSSSIILIDGNNVAIDAYNIEGANYIKLRSLAYILSGSAKQFDINWDSDKNEIILASGKPYLSDGNEMTGNDAGEKAAIPASSKVFLDGREVVFTAYNIEGANYFKLRDAGVVFDFSVDWDSENNTIEIDTNKSYMPGTAIQPPVLNNDQINWKVQYIRTNGYVGGTVYPVVSVIASKAELTQYYDNYKDKYDFSSRLNLYPGQSIGFIDAIENYSDTFFTDRFLVLLLFEEGSGSIKHRVDRVEENGNLIISRLLPEIGTDDMAEWHIIIELDNTYQPEQFNAIFIDESV